MPDRVASTVNTTPPGSWEPLSSPVRNSRPTSAAQLFGEFGEGEAAAEPLVLVDDEGDRDAGSSHLAREGDGPFEFGPLGGAGGDGPLGT
jgi:hypothetical protein